jgi:hypothetical protein
MQKNPKKSFLCGLTSLCTNLKPFSGLVLLDDIADFRQKQFFPSSRTGLPDGIFSNQTKISIWVNLGGSCNEICWHMYFMAIWPILRPFGTYVYVVAIW